MFIMFIMFVTKPSNDSFGEFISRHAPFGHQTFIKIVTNSNAKIMDYGFFKTAKLNDGPTDVNGIGIFNNWFVLTQQYKSHRNPKFNILVLNGKPHALFKTSSNSFL